MYIRYNDICVVTVVIGDYSEITQNCFSVLDAYKPSYHFCLFPLQVVSWEIFVHLGSVHAEEWGSLNLVCK